MNSRDDDETFTRELLERAGPRPAVAEEELTAIRDVARAAWRERYGRRERSRSWMLPLAARGGVFGATGSAASAFFAGGAAWPS